MCVYVVFVIQFDGDIRASQVERLREEITGIITLTRSDKPSPLPSSATETAVVDSKLQREINKINARKAAELSAIQSLSSPGMDTDSPAAPVGSVDLTTLPDSLTHTTTTEVDVVVAAPVSTSTSTSIIPSSPSPSSISTAPRDRVVVVLKSGGGTVTGYGLAAAQLSRIKEAGLGHSHTFLFFIKITFLIIIIIIIIIIYTVCVDLTVCVDEVAASGGYLMASVAGSVV